MRARLVEEYINFERTSNPLSSMGLGGFSFDTLQPGAIIQSKRYFGVTEKTGNITGYHSGKTKIGKGNYLLITEVRKTSNPEIKNLSFHRYIDLETAKKEKEKFKDGGTRTLSWWGIPRGFFSSMTKSKFNYRFDIIEPGFNVSESVNFQRGLEPKKVLGLGRPFGFTKDLLDLSHNDGKNILFVRPDFVEKLKAEGIYQYDTKRLYFGSKIELLYFGNDLIGRWGYRKKDYQNHDGTFKGPYSCNFRLFNRGGDLYMLQGSSGDYGFGGMQRTQSETIGPTFRKSLYEQVYNYLMNKWVETTNESMNFDRGGNIYRKLKIGRSFWNLEPGAILKPIKDIYIGPRTNFVSGPYGTKIWEESYVTVIDLEKTPSGLMKIYYHQNWDLAGAEVVRDNIKLYPRGLSMTGTEKQFKNRFIIHES
ncbi:MAG TPA: hypothetical protein PK122_02565 [Candidatus Paceibacterota bacterium]|nr:hypothetical protein [Candidatus Paceibacterota bacterium]